jgi:acyl-CoA thioesterase FadM
LCDVALYRAGDGLSRPAAAARRAGGAYAGDAGRHQPVGRHLRRLDHVVDGFRRRDYRDPHAEGRVVTASVSNIAFLQPVKVGDVVCCYTDIIRLGRSSMTLCVEIWVLRQGRGRRVKVTAAEFTFVARDNAGKPRPIAGLPSAGAK